MTSTPAPTPKLKVLCPSCTQKLDVSEIAPFTKVPCPACGVPLCVPKPYGNYMLEEFLGGGGTADVFRTLDATLDREVALKILRTPLAADPLLADRFLAAAKQTAALSHPGIVPIYSCGEADGKAFLVMQYLARTSLARRLKAAAGERLPLDFCCATFLQVAQGLDAAQRRGILHQHICPQNILFDAEDRAKIADFGLAVAGWREDREPAQNLQACHGDLPHVSPETALRGAATLHADLYSFGATLHEALAGVPPVAPERLAAAYRQRLAPEPEPLRARRPGLPEPLYALVQSLLAAEPEQRPDSYEPVIRTLEDLQKAGRGKKKRVVSLAGMRRPGPRQNGATPPPAPAGAHQHGLLFYLLLAAIFIALAAAAFLVLGGALRRPWYVAQIEPLVQRLAQTVTPPPPGDAFAALDLPPPLPPPPAAGRPPAPPDATGPGTAPPAAASLDDFLAGTFLDAPAPTLAPPLAPTATTATGGGQPRHALPDALAARRPRPADLNFKAIEAELRAYLRTLPAEWQATEKEQLQALGGLRAHLIRLLKFPYDGPRGVRLANGRTLPAVVTLANERTLTLRLGDRARQIGWNQLHPVQYQLFLEFYIQKRLEMPAPAGAGAQAELRRAAANELYRLALLCDWYGDRPAARRQAARAATLDPTLQERINRLLGSLP
ncbi:MAG: protein kinase [Lentisphaeria bacterium]